MGPGHLAVAFAVKPITPRAPLWVLLVASEALDLLYFGFLAVGVENAGVSQSDIAQGVRILEQASIPWSHGLFMTLVWSVVATALAYLVFRERRASGVIGLLVFSHWALDFVVHLPDLPLLFNGSAKLGLGLWGTGPGLVLSGILEIIMLAAGIVIYLTNRNKSQENQQTKSPFVRR